MKLFFSIISFILMLSAFGQQYEDVNDPKQIKSLLKKESVIEGFGGVDMKVGDVVGERSLIVGGYGGVVINSNYLLGLGAYGITTKPSFDGVIPNIGTEKRLTVYGGYGGILIGGNVLSKEVVHLSIPVLLGAGNLDISDDDFFQGIGDTSFTVESSVFFVIEPGAQLEVNVTKYLRIGIGATYRWVQGLELENLSDGDVTGYNGMLSLRFGRF